VIVLDAGDSWQLVCQPDHGDLAGQIAAAWGNDEFVAPRAHASVVVAARRHDDGWAVWERWPEIASDSDGRPMSFLEAEIPSHIDFYRAAITDVTERDSYAGLLVAMHGAGLYRSRYDTHPAMGRLAKADVYEAEIERFLGDIEGSYPRRMAELGIDEIERWTNYKLLQVFDRLSLYLSGFFKLAMGDVHVLGPVPVDYDGTEMELRIEPLAPFEPFSPRHIAVKPYPFRTQPTTFTLKRRVLSKRSWTSDEFRQEFANAPSETIEIRADAS
jgi:hypothetical protein